MATTNGVLTNTSPSSLPPGARAAQAALASQATDNNAATGANHVPHDSLSVCSSSKEDDLAKIRELEEEVRYLAEKANTASQRFADYENEIRVLQAKLRQEQRKKSAVETIAESPESEKGGSASTPPATEQRPGISRFGSFMGRSKSTIQKPQQELQPNGAVPAAAAGREKELEEKLVQEQTTRIAAEKRVKEVNAEIEDLSATLFQQANEMVASERKENSELKDKIRELEMQQQEQMEQQKKLGEGVAKASGQLEKENEKLKEKIKALEERESQRKRRLEKLEAANKRIERVKAMLAPP